MTIKSLRSASRPAALFGALVLLGVPAASAAVVAAGSSATAMLANPPPKSWIDPDTGHRVIRLTDEPDSLSFYFNVNPYTPAGKKMAYTTADGGIGVVDLTTFKAKSIVPGACPRPPCRQADVANLPSQAGGKRALCRQSRLFGHVDQTLGLEHATGDQMERRSRSGRP